MFAFQYDREGFFSGVVECDRHPIRPHAWIVPGMATLAHPPEPRPGEWPRWTGTGWVLAPSTRIKASTPLQRVRAWFCRQADAIRNFFDWGWR